MDYGEVEAEEMGHFFTKFSFKKKKVRSLARIDYGLLNHFLIVSFE